MRKYALGHDFGNSETDDKASVNGTWLDANMPTVEATIDKSKFDQLSATLAPNSGLITMAGDHTIYILGEEVLIQSPNAMSHLGYIERYASKSSLRALLINACRMIPDKQFSLSVTTGIPVSTYIKDKEIKDLIRVALNGTHAFTVTYHNSAGEVTTQEREVFIEVNKIVMEGAGAILAHGEGGDVKQSVVDIGGGTCDIYTTRGQKPLIEQCNSKDLGVEASIDILKNNFLLVHGRDLHQGEARDMMLAYIGVKPYPSIVVRGKTITTTQQRVLVEESIRIVGEKIESFISTTLKEGNTKDSVAASIKSVFAVGRGSIFYAQYLKRTISPDQLKLVTNPGSDNAYGYAIFSKHSLDKVPRIAS
jgi:plasmid segregation protein ParM